VGASITLGTTLIGRLIYNLKQNRNQALLVFNGNHSISRLIHIDLEQYTNFCLFCIDKMQNEVKKNCMYKADAYLIEFVLSSYLIYLSPKSITVIVY
jgi:hypothetical protein